MSKRTIYFLSTGNSCRSQMAEGWAKKHLSNEWEIHSAGVKAIGVNTEAVKVMSEVGIDISLQTSDIIDPYILNTSDLVVTLCTYTYAEENCPSSPPHVKRVHWGVDDPAKAKGSAEEKRAAFQRVRDEIGDRIIRFLADEGYFMIKADSPSFSSIME